MSTPSTLTNLSNDLADAVATAAPAIVQVYGRRRPVSGIVYADAVVVTNARALGREDGLHVVSDDGKVSDAELAGWDPATGLAVLRVPGLIAPRLVPSEAPARVGHLTIALARSWSNKITASTGIVAVIGGPLATGRRHAIEEVIRTTAPMHDGFAGGALIDTNGGLIGVTTAAEIRGLAVVIPVRIAWTTASALLEHGTIERGYLGIAGQPAQLPEAQRQGRDRDHALLVVGITPGSPADTAGLFVGDLLLDFDGQAIGSPEDLLDLLAADRIGRSIPVQLLRGTNVVSATVNVGKRPK